MTLDAYIARRFADRGVRLYHAENLRNFETYCRNAALLCRKELMRQDSSGFTRFYSDSSDESRGVLGRVFGNVYDFGAVFERGRGAIPNIYGPITLVFAPTTFSVMRDIVITPRSIVNLSEDWRSHGVAASQQVEGLLAGDSFGSPIVREWQFAELSCANNALSFSHLEKVVVDDIQLDGRRLGQIVGALLAQHGLKVPVQRRVGRNDDVLGDLVDMCAALPPDLTEERWSFDVAQLPPSSQRIAEERRRLLGLWCHNFYFGTLLPVRHAFQSAEMAPIFDPADILDRLLPDLAGDLVHSNEAVISTMATTNATGFGLDWYEIDSADADDDCTEIEFQATLYLSGDNDEDHVWCGDTVEVTMTGIARLDDDSNWRVSDYTVENCSIEDDHDYDE